MSSNDSTDFGFLIFDLGLKEKSLMRSEQYNMILDFGIAGACPII
jgi:hypothetical protein